MRAAFALALLLLTSSRLTLAATPAAPASACGAASKPCQPAPAAVLTVSIQNDAAKVATAVEATVDHTPFRGWYAQSALMRWMVWYCALMFPIAIVGLTVMSMLEVRKRKLRDR